jgi:hypothetical protein
MSIAAAVADPPDVAAASVPPVMPPVARPAVARPSVVRVGLHRAAFWAVLAVVAVAVGVAGLVVRRWAWDQTEPIRFLADIDNAFRQGTRTLAVGYVERYDDELAQPQHAWVMGLDYGPGRLAVATLWARWVRSQVTAVAVGPDPAIDQWYVEFYARARELGRTYELCRPLLLFNLTGEALAAAAMFLLVRRYASEGGTRPARGAVLGLVAASFFWLDPALISNAHCWPQWDSWVLPFLLWATLAASCDRWFCAGVLVALGAGFKGQILFCAPLFLLWPLFQGRAGAAARWVAGVASATACVTAAWAIRAPGHAQRAVLRAGHLEWLTVQRVTGHQGDPRGASYLQGHANVDAIRWVAEATVAFAIIAIVVRGRARWLDRLMPPAWAGWTDRDPSAGRVAAGIAMAVAGLAGGAALTVAGVALIVAFSVPVGVAVLATAAGAAVWGAWVAGLLPADLPGRLAAWPRTLTVAARGGVLMLALLMGGEPLWQTGVARVWPVAGAVLAAMAIVWWVRRRALATAAAAWVAGAVLLCAPLFGGSAQWFFVGIAHGTIARPGLSLGDNNNLANLLATKWGWKLEDPTFTLPPGRVADRVAGFLRAVDPHVELPPGQPVGLPLKYLLVVVWAGLTVACAFGAARHDRRRDARFLVAVAAPWVAMFAILGQMHQRYLLWGSALTCMAVGVSPGLLLLHLLLSVVAAGQEMVSMMGSSKAPGMTENVVFRLATGWAPGMGWAVLETAGLLVYLAATRGRSRGRELAGRPV